MKNSIRKPGKTLFLLKNVTKNQINIICITHSWQKVFLNRVSTEKTFFSLGKKSENPMGPEICPIP
jgi:ACT domain-containing protein